MWKITVEDMETGHKVETVHEQLNQSHERGMSVERSPGGHLTGIEPNDHSRLLVQAWSGCDTFEDFESQTDVEPPPH